MFKHTLLITALIFAHSITLGMDDKKNNYDLKISAPRTLRLACNNGKILDTNRTHLITNSLDKNNKNNLAIVQINNHRYNNLVGHTKQVFTAQFNPKNKNQVTSGGADGVYVWDLTSKQIINHYKDMLCMDLKHNPISQEIIIGLRESTKCSPLEKDKFNSKHFLLSIDPRSKQPTSFFESKKPITSNPRLTLSNNGQLLGYVGNEVKIWDMRKRDKALFSKSIEMTWKHQATHLRFNHNNTRFYFLISPRDLYGALKGKLKVVDINENTISTKRENVSTISSDGTHYVTQQDNIHRWHNIQTSQVVKQLKGFMRVRDNFKTLTTLGPNNKYHISAIGIRFRPLRPVVKLLHQRFPLLHMPPFPQLIVGLLDVILPNTEFYQNCLWNTETKERKIFFKFYDDLKQRIILQNYILSTYSKNSTTFIDIDEIKD